MPARHVIHTPGPVWHGGGHGEAALLAACYRNSLALAMGHGCRSVAFPCISTGVYGFPKETAARIAVETVVCVLFEHPGPVHEVIFCCFSDTDLHLYRAVLNGNAECVAKSR